MTKLRLFSGMEQLIQFVQKKGGEQKNGKGVKHLNAIQNRDTFKTECVLCFSKNIFKNLMQMKKEYLKEKGTF
jgi:hypothetical protein